SVCRLSHHGGVKRISGLDPWCSQNLAREHVIRNSVTYIEHAVTALDIVCALKDSSCTLYSFGA
ncbi:hypothetical protein B0H13DRAFT_1473986, partial [Mycena leptocephala]